MGKGAVLVLGSEGPVKHPFLWSDSVLLFITVIAKARAFFNKCVPSSGW
jgi:hypothetical protein